MWKTILLSVLLGFGAEAAPPATAETKPASAPVVAPRPAPVSPVQSNAPRAEIYLKRVGATWIPVMRVIFRALEEAADGTEIGNGWQSPIYVQPPARHLGSESHGTTRPDARVPAELRHPVNPYFDPIS